MPTHVKEPTPDAVKKSAANEAQSLMDQADDHAQDLVQDNADSTDYNVRYAAYLRRIRDVARASSRYTAYTSDIGEAFRPVVPPSIVTAAYGISWAYLVGDVGFTTYKARRRGPTPLEAASMTEPTRLAMVTVKRAVFQGVASMALPAFTIHSAVKFAGRRFARSTSPVMKRWGPTTVGIGIVPFLPYLFDEPVEHVVDFAFDKIEEMWFRNKVPPRPTTLNPKKDL